MWWNIVDGKQNLGRNLFILKQEETIKLLPGGLLPWTHHLLWTQSFFLVCRKYRTIQFMIMFTMAWQAYFVRTFTIINRTFQWIQSNHGNYRKDSLVWTLICSSALFLIWLITHLTCIYHHIFTFDVSNKYVSFTVIVWITHIITESNIYLTR